MFVEFTNEGLTTASQKGTRDLWDVLWPNNKIHKASYICQVSLHVVIEVLVCLHLYSVSQFAL